MASYNTDKFAQYYNKGAHRSFTARDEHKELNETLDRWLNAILIGDDQFTAGKLAHTNLEDIKKVQETFNLVYELYDSYMRRCEQLNRIETELTAIRHDLDTIRYRSNRQISYSKYVRDRDEEMEDENDEND